MANGSRLFSAVAGLGLAASLVACDSTPMETINGRCNVVGENVTVQDKYGILIYNGEVSATSFVNSPIQPTLHAYNLEKRDNYDTDDTSSDPFATPQWAPSSDEIEVTPKTGRCILNINKAYGRDRSLRIVFSGFETHPEFNRGPGEYSIRASNGEPLPKTTFAPPAEQPIAPR